MHPLDQAESEETKAGWAELGGGIALASPQTVYKSPLQRAGEALRAQQAGTACVAFAKNNAMGLSLLPVTSKPAGPVRLRQQSGEKSSATVYPNFSYKMVPAGPGSSLRCKGPRSGHSSSGERHEGDCSGINTNTRKQVALSEGMGLLSSLFSNPRTQRAPFKPQKSGRGTSSWQLKQYAEATLGSGSLRKAVKLPEGEDKDEWLAVNGKSSTVGAEAFC